MGDALNSKGAIMSKRIVGVASLFLLTAAACANAAPLVFNVDSVVHGVLGPTGGGTPLNTGALNTLVSVQAGDTVSISTAPTDRWNINSQMVTAAGFPDGYFGYTSYMHNHANFSVFGEFSISPIDFGALAYSLDGVNWAGAYNDVSLATSVLFTAASAGTLYLAMWDSIVSDNNSGIGSENNLLHVTVDVTPGNPPPPSNVPEPGTLMMSLLALAGLGSLRRERRGA